MSAAITPGIQPHRVKINTINTEPQPLSITANGGNKIDNKTRQILIETKLRLKIQYIGRTKYVLLHQNLWLYSFYVATLLHAFFNASTSNFFWG